MEHTNQIGKKSMMMMVLQIRIPELILDLVLQARQPRQAQHRAVVRRQELPIW
jgi:hypothetical protein